MKVVLLERKWTVFLLKSHTVDNFKVVLLEEVHFILDFFIFILLLGLVGSPWWCICHVFIYSFSQSNVKEHGLNISAFLLWCRNQFHLPPVAITIIVSVRRDCHQNGHRGSSNLRALPRESPTTTQIVNAKIGIATMSTTVITITAITVQNPRLGGHRNQWPKLLPMRH